MTGDHFNIKGLTDEEVADSRKKYGTNALYYEKEHGVYDAIKEIAREPMVVLLLLASLLYFINGKYEDGIFLGVSILMVSAISLLQNYRSGLALKKLQSFIEPRSKVIRNGEAQEINSVDVVVGDMMLVDEGKLVNADGIIIHSNDFSVNESSITGESLPAFKDKFIADNRVFSGTIVTSGLAIFAVTAIGNSTKLGRIGQSLKDIAKQKTPLELQIGNFVKKMAMIGAAVFLLVWALNYMQQASLVDSLLKSLTLAMSILPEEIPVAFATFMAIGSWRLMKKGVVIKQMNTVETLGSATVICTDKTGTITQNHMALATVFVWPSQQMVSIGGPQSQLASSLVETAMWASEPIPFDPMEISLHEAYGHSSTDGRAAYKMVHEYPLDGKPPMMTHVFENAQGKRIIAAKGAAEALLAVSSLTEMEKRQIMEAAKKMSVKGYRVLGVGSSYFSGTEFPPRQQDLEFAFCGLIAFYDPPKDNIKKVFADFYQAGIKVKIITGDNPETTKAIAEQIGFKNPEKCLTGEQLFALSDGELQEAVKDVNIYARMFPEAKLKIINALKANGEIVAMTGDGINDGPALKAAHIGIAMGKKGTEIAKNAAALILVEDDLAKMVEAVAMGRRIYANLKKAIGYIISIHIPIILIVFLPLALGWRYPNIFSPVHIIFLELIMGPTCSVVYENEPIEKNAMLQKPRPFSTTFFSFKELSTSIVQGLAIAAVVLGVYYFSVLQAYNEAITRTMVFTALITANVFLTLENRSSHYSLLATLKFKNGLIVWVIGFTSVLLLGMLYFMPITKFFGFQALGISQLLLCLACGFASVVWFEVVKWKNRRVSRS